MLAEIDKDARDIKILQEENQRLKSDIQTLQKKVAQHEVLKKQIDKDAHDIKVVQEENRTLKSDIQTLQKKVAHHDRLHKQLELMKGEMRELQQFMAKWKALDSAPILLNAETMEKVVLEPFDDIKGRRLYHAPVDKDGSTRYVAGRNLRVIKVCGGGIVDPDRNMNKDRYQFNCCPRNSHMDHRNIYHTNHDIEIEVYFKTKYATTHAGKSIVLHKYTCTTSSPVNYCPDSSYYTFTFHPTTNVPADDSTNIIQFSLFLIEVL